MYRVVCLGHKWHAIEIKSIENDLENINEFVDNADPVIIVNELWQVEDLLMDEIEIVEKEDEE
jgi:hypothetical protein